MSDKQDKFASSNLTAGQLNALVKKVGGEDLVMQILRDEAEVAVSIKPLSPTAVIKFTGDFNPKAFIGKDWKILPEETDTQGEDLSGLDFSKVRFETCLKEGEVFTTGEERLIRLKAGHHVRLGAKAFKACWDNRQSLPENWKEDGNGNTRYIFFDGMVLQSPLGRRYTLCMYWSGGAWDWYYYWLDLDRDANDPSAVSAS